MVFRRLFAVLAFLLATVTFSVSAADDVASAPAPVPVWPMAGTDADVEIAPSSVVNKSDSSQNIRIVSRIGADMNVENNINLSGSDIGDSFSGGANMTHPYQAPSGFNLYSNQGEMPFMHTEMPDDDGASVLAISKSDRKVVLEPRVLDTTEAGRNAILTDIAVDEQTMEPVKDLRDQVRSWVVASGQNLRDVLQSWCDKEGWDLIWNTPREYPIAASAVFKGRFLDVSSALVRNFSRASPIPYAKFYKGNRVLVIGTTEDD